LPIFRKIENKIYSLILGRTGHVQESQDMVQDVYESALRNLDSFNLVEDQAAWLFRTAGNKIIDWYRAKARQQHVSLDNSGGGEETLLDLMVDDRVQLEDSYFRDLLYEALSCAIDALPDEYRVVIQAQALDGFSFRELAEEWGIPQGTLLSRKRKAVAMLREALKDFYDVWTDIQNK